MLRLKNALRTRSKKLSERLKRDIPCIVRCSLEEDLGPLIDSQADLTASLIGTAPSQQATIITRENGIFCGKAWAEMVFELLSHANQESVVTINWSAADGEPITIGQQLCVIEGPAEILLTAERTLLNFIQTLSGVATLTRKYVETLKGTQTRILDTRKTIPGLRSALKYAVTCGGGSNHRLGLDDCFLLKENHLMLFSGNLKLAIARARALQPSIPIEVEVETVEQLLSVLELTPDIIMLDNFSIKDAQTAVRLVNSKIPLELSGNITLDNLLAYAETGVNFISIGALTKHIHALDFSMRFIQ